MITCFTTSTLLSRHKAKRKADRIGAIVEKGGNRDAFQVVANGGVFTMAALGFLVAPSSFWLCAGAGALGAAASDTWATEIGVLVNHAPRSILTGRLMSAGESGGITVPGSLAAIFGALAMAAVAFLFGWGTAPVVAAAIGGIGGCAFDSILGATLQTRRWCPKCEANTERPIHNCGTPTTVATGLPWMNNDAVNALCTLAGAIIGVLSCLAILN
jgi:uncharacterized protein (TIGR00297 family)